MRSFAVVALSVAPLMAWIAGCGGDDSSSGGSSGTTPDSSTGTSSSGGSSSGGSSGSPMDSSTGPSANATSTTLYIGSVAKLDGSTSTGSGLAYAWTIKTVPAGSAITTASLATANTATTTFTPDKLGVYELELTVTSGTQTSKATAMATVIDPPIFYYESSSDPDAGTFASKLLVTGGTAPDGGKPVACFDRDSGAYGTFNRYTATGGTDWWEAPAGQPSKAAFVMETTLDGGTAQTLFATTSNGSCATAPTKLDGLPPPATGHTYEQPRISPDGMRVAFARQAAEGAQVVAVGLDGANLRVLGSRMVDDDGGAVPEAGLPPVPASRPFWQGNTHVAWIESIAGDAWQVARAADAANATREVLARCSGSPPSQAAFLATGEILVSQPVAGVGVQLIAYPIVAATKSCGTGRVLTPAPDGGQTVAMDFVLSPDGKEVAYKSDEGGVSETRAVKVDGTSAPRKIGNTIGTTRGPRYIGAGSYLSFANGAAPLDAGYEAGVIAVVPTDGGNYSVAATGPTVEAIGNGIFSACNMGAGAGSGVAFAGIASLAMLRLARGRRRRDD